MDTPIRCTLFIVSKDPHISAYELNAVSDDHFEVHFMHDVQTAIQWAASPNVSAWIVDESIGDNDAAMLFERLEEQHSGVPFLYVASQGELLSGFGTVLPDALLRTPVEESDLLARLHELWRRDLFDPAVVEASMTSFKDTVAEFMPDVEIHDVGLRAGNLPVHSVNADISFCGPSITGKVSLSASAATFRTIHRALLPGAVSPTPQVLEDLAGEVANSLLGGLKRALMSGGIELASGVPTMFSSGLGTRRDNGGATSLLLRLRSASATIKEVVVGLSLSSLRASFTEAEVSSEDDNDIQSGEMAFF